jgi:hypothetical protein
LEVLERLREKDGNDPNVFPTTHGSCIYNNAPAHTVMSVREVYATTLIIVLEHHAYSPDLARGTFFLFTKIKEILKGGNFDDIDDIRNNTAAALKAIPQNQF